MVENRPPVVNRARGEGVAILSRDKLSLNKYKVEVLDLCFNFLYQKIRPSPLNFGIIRLYRPNFDIFDFLGR